MACNSFFLHFNTLGRHYKAEEADFIGMELTLLGVCKKSGLLEPFKDTVYMLLVVLRFLREDQDIVQVDNANSIY